MDWGEVLAIVVSNMGMFLWATRQARTDFHQNIRMNESLQKDIKDLCVKVGVLEEKLRR